jgi:hypothetical protein
VIGAVVVLNVTLTDPLAGSRDAGEACEERIVSEADEVLEIRTGDPQPTRGGWELFGTYTADEHAVEWWHCLACGEVGDWKLSEVMFAPDARSVSLQQSRTEGCGRAD